MHKKYFDRKNELGITLVALVITIVILIILAVVAINAVFGDSGLLQYAQDTRNYQANSDALDDELINSATEYIDGIISGNDSGEDIPTEPTIPSTVEEAKNTGHTFDNTTNLKDDLDNDVTVPGGFHIAEDSGTKIEEGIVIEDETGNQFVWIPVGEYQTTDSDEPTKTNNLSRKTFTSSGVTEVNGDDVISTYFYGEGNENSVAKGQIEGFKNSSTINKGFYIGRYEAGTEVERTNAGDELTTPLVQANKNAYVYVTRDEAKTQAEAMFSENEFVTSELISSYAWDTTLNFICQNNEEGYVLATTTDSTYGNIGTNTKELTGIYEADNYSNIYDFLGNCREWSTEYSSFDGYPCANSGGVFNYSTPHAAYHAYETLNGSDQYNSFRIILYIQ